MTPTNCPNCGAVVHGVQCEYCGTRFHGYGRSYTVTVHSDVDGCMADMAARGLLTCNEARAMLKPSDWPGVPTVETR